MRRLLADEVKRKLSWTDYDQYIVHHYTDRKDSIQVEWEKRLGNLVWFGRTFLEK